MFSRTRLSDSSESKEIRTEKERSQLLLSLKNTVEGLLANRAINVWNTCGALNRLCSDLENIFNHRLRRSEGINDYWKFFCALYWIKPSLAPTLLRNSTKDSQEKTVMGIMWLTCSLQEHTLSSQLEALIAVKEHLFSCYDDEALLCHEAYTNALLTCLRAVELNQPALLAELDPTLVVRHIQQQSRTVISKEKDAALPTEQSANFSSNKCDNSSDYKNVKLPNCIMDRLLYSVNNFEYLNSSVNLSIRSQRSLARHKKRDQYTGVKYKKSIFCDTKRFKRCFKSASTSSHYPFVNIRKNKNIQRHSVLKSSLSLLYNDSVIVKVHKKSLYKSNSPSKSESASLVCNKPSCETIPAIQNTSFMAVWTRDKFFDNVILSNLSCRHSLSKSHTTDCINVMKKSITVIVKNLSYHLISQTKLKQKSLSGSTLDLKVVKNYTDGLNPQETQKSICCELSSRSIECLVSPGFKEVTSVPSIDCIDQSYHTTFLQKTCPIEKAEQDTSANVIPSYNDNQNWKAQHSRSRSDVPYFSPMSYSAVEEANTRRAVTPPPLSSSLPVNLSAKQQKRCSLLEGDSRIVVPTECFFPRPQKGQSLTSFLLSKDFLTCAEMDKENAHFCVSEALISAIEQMKCNQVLEHLQKDETKDETDEASDDIEKQKVRIRWRERHRDKSRSKSTPFNNIVSPSTSSPYSSSNSSASGCAGSSETDDVDDLEFSEASESKLSSIKENGLSLSMASLYSDADIHRVSIANSTVNNEDLPKSPVSEQSFSNNLSAESVALCLLKKFSEKQLPKASDLVWLVSEQDAPQRLLPLPDSWPVSPDIVEEEYSLTKTRLRGNLEWAPPRAQIIFSIHPNPKRKVLIAKQNYRCAGCGMKIDRSYASKFRYCEYLGKYFCQCCHINSLAYIPGRILRKWDFTKYYVSKFSQDLLERMFEDPLFNIAGINNSLYRKVRHLDMVREYRLQLFYLKDFILTCRKAKKLQDELNREASHIVSDPDIYSLSDLTKVKNGSLLQHLHRLVVNSVDHIFKCNLCSAKGFICEVCNNEDDIIFPFQLAKVSQCQKCRSCFHKGCFKAESCPKCIRIEARKKKVEEQWQAHSSGEDS